MHSSVWLMSGLTIAALDPSAGASQSMDAAIHAYRGQQYATALKLFEAAAREGSREAQHTLGFMHRNGMGTERNDVKAFVWYRRAADQGYAPAEFNLGLMYAQGEGTKTDGATAQKWFRRAADHGSVEAQVKLAEIAVTEERYEEAFSWFSKAADQDDADAAFNVGSLYYLGRGVAENRLKATEYYRKAARLGMPEAEQVLRGLGDKLD